MTTHSPFFFLLSTKTGRILDDRINSSSSSLLLLLVSVEMSSSMKRSCFRVSWLLLLPWLPFNCVTKEFSVSLAFGEFRSSVILLGGVFVLRAGFLRGGVVEWVACGRGSFLSISGCSGNPTGALTAEFSEISEFSSGGVVS